ncbi:MAG: YicC family protein [Lachnospiraceae bacterium]|nr:YicC family protein [Lachnospiraceae bacterium]
MIKSMTGFGRYEITTDECRLSVEMKSVNHRYLDLSIKMPRQFNAFEAELRNQLKHDIQRGKVDVYVTYEAFADTHTTLKYNQNIAKEYMNILHAISEEFQLPQDMTAGKLARFPEVISMESSEADEEQLLALIKECMEGAVKQFVAQRAREGEQLYHDLMGKLDNMLGWVAEVETRSPQILTEYRQKLINKVSELLAEASLEESRIAQEVTLFADKICVDEETVRLRSHIDAVKKALNKGGAVGRQLDFIAQEMNREANTILSKANDMEISQTAINLKTEIEKVREQIQNIE